MSEEKLFNAEEFLLLTYLCWILRLHWALKFMHNEPINPKINTPKFCILLLRCPLYSYLYVLHVLALSNMLRALIFSIHNIAVQALVRLFNVQGIPRLIFIAYNGSIISEDGVWEVESDPLGENFPYPVALA